MSDVPRLLLVEGREQSVPKPIPELIHAAGRFLLEPFFVAYLVDQLETVDDYHMFPRNSISKNLTIYICQPRITDVWRAWIDVRDIP